MNHSVLGTQENIPLVARISTYEKKPILICFHFEAGNGNTLPDRYQLVISLFLKVDKGC